MSRPPILMKRFSNEAPDRRMRFIAKSAVENDITLRMLADQLGLHETAVRRSFLEVNLRPTTIERYAQALKKDGQSVIPLLERRQLAQLSPAEAREITMRDLREISKSGDVRFIVAEHLLHLENLSDPEKDRMLGTIENLDISVIRKMGRLVRQIQDANIASASVAMQLKKKCELLSDVAGITPAYAMVMAVVSCGADPYSAASAVKSFLATLVNEKVVSNVDSQLAEFKKNEDLSLLSTNRPSTLHQELIALAFANLEQNRKSKP